MVARERQRDKRHGTARRVSWPALVMAGGILLSLAAEPDEKQSARHRGEHKSDTRSHLWNSYVADFFVRHALCTAYLGLRHW
jgi:hypothetical protein